ncbi:MAG: segregation/condensation protein A [Candidatus Omnitrophica bacterium]|nr:segregation/condensation protein A [Candidatus Omnitrophota bacterium]
MRYDVNTPIYEGPLHLLVELAKLNLLDLFVIKLQDLTRQYQELVKAGGRSLNELAEPLPLLGQLMVLKTRLLLPQPPPLEEEDVPVSLEELERRLREYEQFKTVAQVLAQLHALQREHFNRLSTPTPVGADRGIAQAGEELPVLGGKPVGILDLMTAFAQVLERSAASVYEVEQDPWTVEMKVDELRIQLNVKRQLAFHELFSSEKGRLELVVTFLALLELVRQRLCLAIQQQAFGDILIVRREHPAQVS